MTSRLTRRVASIAALAVACCAVPALAEANPAYDSWAKCKPGATTTVEGNSEAMGQKSKQTIVSKLVEVQPDKVIVEVTMTNEMMGQKMAAPATKQEIPKEMPKPPEGAKMPEIKKGKETISVLGKSLECETAEVTTEQNGMKITAKSWSTPEVPGVVKVKTTTSGAMTSTSEMTVVDFKQG